MAACNLPEAVLWLVFDRLDVKSLGRCAAVCFSWRQACKRHPLWLQFTRTRYFYPRLESDVPSARAAREHGNDNNRDNNNHHEHEHDDDDDDGNHEQNGDNDNNEQQPRRAQIIGSRAPNRQNEASELLSGAEGIPPKRTVRYNFSTDEVVCRSGGSGTALLSLDHYQSYSCDLAGPTVYDAYMELGKRDRAWHGETVHESEVLDDEGIDGDATCLTHVPEKDFLLCGFQSGRIKAFTASSLKFAGHLLASHDYEVNALVAQGDTLASAGDDNLIYLWTIKGLDVELWRVIRSFRAADRVKDIFLDMGRMQVLACTHARGLFAYSFSHSNAEKVDIGDSAMTTKPTWGFQNTLGKRNCIHMHMGSVYMGQAEGISVIDPDTGRKLQERAGSTSRGVSQFISHNVMLLGVSTAKNTGMFLIDPRVGINTTVMQTTRGMKSGLRTVANSQFDPWLLVTGGTCIISSPEHDLSTVAPPVQLWDLRMNMTPFGEVFGHQARTERVKGVTGIVITDDTIFTCGIDATLRYVRIPALSTGRKNSAAGSGSTLAVLGSSGGGSGSGGSGSDAGGADAGSARVKGKGSGASSSKKSPSIFSLGSKNKRVPPVVLEESIGSHESFFNRAWEANFQQLANQMNAHESVFHIPPPPPGVLGPDAPVNDIGGSATLEPRGGSGGASSSRSRGSSDSKKGCVIQ